MFAARASMLGMSDAPTIKLPPGMLLREDGAGGYEVVNSKEPMSKTVAFRMTPSNYTIMLNLMETFPERSWGAAFRWLLNHDTVTDVIANRISSSFTLADTLETGVDERTA